MKRFRIQLVWALIVLICGVSLMGLIYIVFNKPEVYINPGIVVTQPSPVAEPAAPLGSITRRIAIPIIRRRPTLLRVPAKGCTCTPAQRFAR